PSRPEGRWPGAGRFPRYSGPATDSVFWTIQRKSDLSDLRAFECRSRVNPRSVSAADHIASRMFPTCDTYLRSAGSRDPPTSGVLRCARDTRPQLALCGQAGTKRRAGRSRRAGPRKGGRDGYSRMLGASGTFFQWVRLSAMILVDCMAAWVM